MVLKEPRLVSEKFYGRKSWPLRGSKPLVVDSFGSGGPQFAPRLEQLAIPWGALTYASRGLSPAELYIPATVDRVSASISKSNTAATGSSDADRLGLRRGHCAFMGRSDGARGAWGDFIPPGYKYRGALIRALNCTRLLPGDRNAIHIPRSEGAGRGGGGGGGYAINYPPMQFGPFEGTRRHYAGYRYVLAVENTDEGSPVSEKMVNAFLADATPIVWGGGAHKDVFNPASYVDCSALSPEACAAVVRALDAKPDALRAMRAAPRFADRSRFDRFFAWSRASEGSRAQQALHRRLGAWGTRVGLCKASDRR